MSKWLLPIQSKPTDYKERYEAALRDAKEAEAYMAELEDTLDDIKARSEDRVAATKRLRRKLEILKLDASKARAQLFHDLQECLALMDIIERADQ
jgi:hypothetical protein